MALISMTGFGRGEASTGGMKVEVELSSVNRKQFDLHFSLPKPLAAHEARIYEIIHAAISRGYITGSVRITASGTALRSCASVDETMAKAYVVMLRKAAKDLGLKDDLSARTLVTLPEVVRFENPEEHSEKIWPLMKKALEAAIDRLMGMKRAEGGALEKDLGKRFGVLRTIAAAIQARAPDVPRRYREALKKRLAEAGIEALAEDKGVLKEVAVFADRCDISEELVRLDSHFEQAGKLMKSKQPVGRTFDFLCQEMFREINTTGSKANDADISRDVIEFKAGLEAIREQVQNVE